MLGLSKGIDGLPLLRPRAWMREQAGWNRPCPWKDAKQTDDLSARVPLPARSLRGPVWRSLSRFACSRIGDNSIASICLLRAWRPNSYA